MTAFEAAHRVLVEAIVARVFPAAAIEVGSSEGVLDSRAFGTLTFSEDSPRTEVHTPFDLASLTKVVATTTAVMQLVGQGALGLDEPVAAFFEEWRGEDRQSVTIGDLLEHASGLAARLVDPPGGGRRESEHDICTMRLEYGPRTRSIYSDLGFILLGFVVADRGAPRVVDPLEPAPLEAMSLDSISLESATSGPTARGAPDPPEVTAATQEASPDAAPLDPVSLDSVSLESVVSAFPPRSFGEARRPPTLDGSSHSELRRDRAEAGAKTGSAKDEGGNRTDHPLTFRLPPEATGRAAPTMPMEDDSRRGRLLQGEVHDNYAAALGGIAGHAGLFGTAPAVGAFAQAMLRATRGSPDEPFPFSPPLVMRFIAASSVPGSSRALGWDRMLPTSSCGTRMSKSAFGHVGFTGTSLWIDPARDRYFVLLTNRACGGGTLDEMRDVRRAFHDALGDV